MTAGGWWHRSPPRDALLPVGLRPGAEACWCCGQPGREYKAGWLECRACDVEWYGGTAPLVLSNGVRGLR